MNTNNLKQKSQVKKTSKTKSITSKKERKCLKKDSPQKISKKKDQQTVENPQLQQQNEERFYCKNQNLLHEMLKWKNSTKCGFHVLKMVNGKLVETKRTQDDYEHEKYVSGTQYFIQYPKTNERYELVMKNQKKYGQISVSRSGIVTEDVTEKVKGMGYAFDIDDDENNRTFSEIFGVMLMTIGKKVSNHSFFRNYSNELKEDMRAYGYEKVIRGLSNYNFKYENAFSYITQAFFNSFKSILSKHYKQVNIKRDLTKKAMVDLQSEVPGSSMEKCLGNQFKNNDYDDFSQF